MSWPRFPLFVRHLAFFLWPLYDRGNHVADSPSQKVTVWCWLRYLSDRCVDAPFGLLVLSLYQTLASLSWCVNRGITLLCLKVVF